MHCPRLLETVVSRSTAPITNRTAEVGVPDHSVGPHISIPALITETEGTNIGRSEARGTVAVEIGPVHAVASPAIAAFIAREMDRDLVDSLDAAIRRKVEGRTNKTGEN